MVKEEKERNTQESNQEELMKSEFGFVYDFFISQKKSGVSIQGLTKNNHKKQEKTRSRIITKVRLFFFLIFLPTKISSVCDVKDSQVKINGWLSFPPLPSIDPHSIFLNGVSTHNPF